MEKTMTDQMNETTKTRTPWAKRLMIGTATVVVLAGLGGVAAVAGQKHHGGWDMMPGPGMRGEMGREFMEFRLEKTMDRIDATPEQRVALKALLDKTMESLKPDQKGGPRTMHEAAIKLLAAPTVDAAAVEALRASSVAEMDAKSKIIASAVLEAANILKPEQRAKLAEDMSKHGPGGMGGPDDMPKD